MPRWITAENINDQCKLLSKLLIPLDKLHHLVSESFALKIFCLGK